jgi:hypothetical protein
MAQVYKLLLYALSLLYHVKSDCVHHGIFEYKCIHSFVHFLISHLPVFLQCKMKALCHYVTVLLFSYLWKTQGRSHLRVILRGESLEATIATLARQ